MRKNKYVNGPLNVIRLEWKGKAINIYFDIHMNIDLQSRCSDVRGINVDKFLAEEFKKSEKKDKNRMIDFFFERGTLHPIHLTANHQDIYIGEVSRLFSESFDINIPENKARISASFPNVRFHHIDVRDYYMRELLYMNNYSYEIRNEYCDCHAIQMLNEMTKYIEHARNIHLYIYYLLFGDKEVKNPEITKSFFEKNMSSISSTNTIDKYNLLKKVIYKILNKYSDDNVKKTIILIINTDLKKIFSEFFDFIESVLEDISKEVTFMEQNPNSKIKLIPQDDGTYDYGRDISEYHIRDKISGKSDMIKSKIIGIGCHLMDLYMIRRFLDKSYVKNAVSYTGAYHSLNYIRILVKYFDFDITHYSYLKDKNIKIIKEKIKKSISTYDLNEYFFPKILNQCSDVESFPEI